jgi:hypothetical protein
LCPEKRPQRKPAGRLAVTLYERRVHVDWNGTFLKLLETDVN